MLIYSAHIPHSPALLRSISRSKLALWRKTTHALSEIAGDLHARQIDTVVFITPHGQGLAETFVVHVARRHKVNLGPVGDFSATGEIGGNPVLAHQIIHKLRASWSIKSAAGEELDAATSAAILQLSHKDTTWNVLPLTYALLSSRELYNFGLALREILESHDGRMALISLGDLARAGRKREVQAAAWDEALIHAITDKKTDFILAISLSEADALHVSAWCPLAVVLGALSEINYSVDVLSYQQRLGVGMAVMRFVF